MTLEFSRERSSRETVRQKEPSDAYWYVACQVVFHLSQTDYYKLKQKIDARNNFFHILNQVPNKNKKWSKQKRQTVNTFKSPNSNEKRENQFTLFRELVAH